MDRETLGDVIGRENLRKAEELLSKSTIEEESDIGYGLTLVRIDDGCQLNTVILSSVRSRYCFTCGSSDCDHSYAAATYLHLQNESVCEDDERVIARLRNEIEDLGYLEPEYDRKDWWDDNGESCDDEVNDICEGIFSLLQEPDNIVTLFSELIDKCYEIEDNSMFGYPDEEWMGRAVDALDGASPETIRDCIIHHHGHWMSDWIENTDLDSLRGIVGDIRGEPSFSEIYYRLGMYDDYIDTSGYDANTRLARVVKTLSSSDPDKAKMYASRISDDGRHRYGEDEKVREALLSIGEVEKVHQKDLELFLESPSDESLEKAMSTGSETKDCLVKMALDRHQHEKEWHYSLMIFMIRNGMAVPARDKLRSNKYNLPLTFYKFNPRELSSVMYALEGQGMRVDAAETAMSIIENILGRRDNKQYYDAVNVLRHFEEMARDDPQVKIMYDGYFQKLKVERARFTKFWGIYNGTYQEKSRSHSYW